MSSPVRIGVVGAGEIAQTTHLPYLYELNDLFELVALAEPSATVRDRLQRRYQLEAAYEDHRALLEHPGLDAIAVCSPNATHADVALGALHAGLHVFVEKPLCITLADADRLIAARDRAGKVAQVGYMNRYDTSFERMRDDLPSSPDEVRAINVLTYDPKLGRFFNRYDTVRARDVGEAVIAATRAAEAVQVEEAVGATDPEGRFVFSEIFLGTLVHDVNVVHGLLEQMGEPLPARVLDGGWWAGGLAVTGTVELANRARWTTTFAELPEAHDFLQTITVLFPDSIRSLAFPAPYLRQTPSTYERSLEQDGVRVVTRTGSFHECYARELERFHDAIVNGASCATPLEQARLDIEVLTEMFLRACDR
ncbi:MAG: Gfo/Idh/MocA family protein [Thermoleophilaceae bacterium]